MSDSPPPSLSESVSIDITDSTDATGVDGGYDHDEDSVSTYTETTVIETNGYDEKSGEEREDHDSLVTEEEDDSSGDLSHTHDSGPEVEMITNKDSKSTGGTVGSSSSSSAERRKRLKSLKKLNDNNDQYGEEDEEQSHGTGEPAIPMIIREPPPHRHHHKKQSAAAATAITIRDNNNKNTDTKQQPKTTTTKKKSPYKSDPSRYMMLFLINWTSFWLGGAYSLAGSAVSAVREYYGLENWYFNFIYYSSYVQFVIMAPIWLYITTLIPLRSCMLYGSLLMIVGYAFQLGYRISFWFVIIGSFIASSISIYFWVSNAIFMSRWFSIKEKALAYSTTFVFGNLGGILAFILSRTLLDTSEHYGERMQWLLIGYLVMSFVSYILNVIFFKEYPDTDPGPQSHKSKISKKNRVQLSRICNPPRSHKRNRSYITLYVVVYVWITSANWALGSLTTELLTDRGRDHTQLLTAGLLYSGLSLATPLVIGYVLGKYHAYRIVVCALLVIQTVVYLIWILVLPYPIASVAITGLLGLTSGAMTLAFAETVIELAFPVLENAWTIIMFLFANIAAVGTIVLASFPQTVNIALWLFLGIFGSGAIATGVSLACKPVTRYYRLTMDKPPSASSSFLPSKNGLRHRASVHNKSSEGEEEEEVKGDLEGQSESLLHSSKQHKHTATTASSSSSSSSSEEEDESESSESETISDEEGGGSDEDTDPSIRQCERCGERLEMHEEYRNQKKHHEHISQD